MTEVSPPSELNSASAHAVKAPDAMRRTPQQLRSRRMVNAIVDSARKILEQEGPEALSTTALELVSGVSKASIYQYFPNLDAVVAEVFHDVIRQRMDEWSDRRGQPLMSLQALVALVVDSSLTLHKELLDLNPEFYCRYSGFYDLWQAFDEFQNLENASMLFLKHHMERCSSEIAGQDTRLLAYALGRSVELTTFAMLRDDPTFLDRAEFRQVLMRIGCAVLSLESAQ